jgi:hypothetical protein
MMFNHPIRLSAVFLGLICSISSFAYPAYNNESNNNGKYSARRPENNGMLSSRYNKTYNQNRTYNQDEPIAKNSGRYLRYSNYNGYGYNDAYANDADNVNGYGNAYGYENSYGNKPVRLGDWDNRENWQYSRHAFFSGETQPEAYRRSRVYGYGGIGYDPDEDYLHLQKEVNELRYEIGQREAHQKNGRAAISNPRNRQEKGGEIADREGELTREKLLRRQGRSYPSTMGDQQSPRPND